MFWNKKKYTNGYSTVSVNGKTVRVRGNKLQNLCYIYSHSDMNGIVKSIVVFYMEHVEENNYGN